MTTPLTKEEWEAFKADPRDWDDETMRRVIATVRAVEAERDAAVARAEKLQADLHQRLVWAYCAGDEGPWIDTEAAAREYADEQIALLAADDAERGDG